MIVLSLCDGMSCGQIALNRIGANIEKYYASEINKHAIKATMANYPDTIQLGDMTKWREWNIDWGSIDLIISGTPCQGFSFAGKQLAFDDPRSKLFFVFAEILNHTKKFNPDVKFLLENVDMKKQYLKIISQYLDVYHQNINSNLVSAQNRSRNYWSNIRTEKIGLFGDVHTSFPIPKDRGIMLKDILEKDVDKKYYISEAQMNRIIKTNNPINEEKARTLNASDWRGINRNQTQTIVSVDGIQRQNQDKSSTFTADGHSCGYHSDMDLICVAMRGRNPENPSDRKTGSPTEQRIEPKTDGKTNCLTSVAKDNLVMTKNYLQWGENNSQANRAFYPDSKNGSLGKGHAMMNPQVLFNKRIRRLTEKEVCRLQTVPDDYFIKNGKFIISSTRIYECCGNGWTVDIIAHILSFLNIK